MIKQDLLDILRCPVCVKENKGSLTVYRDSWLVCDDCGRKYPILREIPVMLIDEGSKWINTPVEQLEVPPKE